MSVVGTDGVVPLYDEHGRWCWFEMKEVYLGDEGAIGGDTNRPKFIPKVNDYVIDAATYTTYRVQSLDPITYIPTLVEIRPGNMPPALTDTDIIFGVGPGAQADTYRVYVDKSVYPYLMAVDIRFYVPGSAASYAKIFKVNRTDLVGEVISKVYNNSGVFISENVPLEMVALDNYTNYAIKTVSVCNTVADLQDNELLVVIVYTDQGNVVQKRQFIVENTSFIRSLNINEKYVSHINLESPFLVGSTIEYPLNVPINALNLIGVVNYSDGSTLKLPVNGTKFKMLGLSQYVSTIVGQKINLVLSYALASNETAYEGVSSDGNYITEAYDLVTVQANNSYTVKLFGYPVWIDEVNGYSMEWWLFNLDRNIYYDVTANVLFDTNTGAFNPKAYGTLQRKSVSVNLKDVSGVFNSFVHVQLIDIILVAPPNTGATPWTVSHVSDDSRPAYGTGLYATKVDGSTINIASGFTSYDDWKEAVYDHIYPLMDRSTEMSVPNPTHLVVSYGVFEIEIPVADWNQNIDTSLSVVLYRPAKIRFIKRTGLEDLQLGIAYLTIKP